MSFLKCLDFFGERIQLSLNNKNSGQTILGGTLFLISIILVALSSWFIGKDIYFKRHPINNQQTIVKGSYPEVNLNSSSFPIAVSLQDINAQFLNDPRYLQIKLNYYEFNTLENGSFVLINSTDVEIAKCRYEDFPKLDKLFFDNFRLKNYLCPQQNINLHGYWSELSLAYLNIEIYACDYTNHPYICATKEDIDNYISNNSISVNLAILDNVISFDNYNNPLTPFLSNPYKFLTKEMKISNIMIQQNQIFTDGGFIFEDYSSINYLKALTLFDDTSLYDESMKQFARLEIYSSNQSLVTYRRYIKIPDILAFVGGILKLVNLLFYYINLKFSQISKFWTVINNLYDLIKDKETNFNLNFNTNLNETNNHNFHQKIKVVKKDQDLKIINNRLVVKRNNDFVMGNLKLGRHEQDIKKIKLTFFEYIQIICKRTSNIKPHVKVYNKFRKRIRQYFDLLYIIKNIIEFQNFKKKSLTKDDQEKIDEHKPSLILNTEKNVYDSCVKELNLYVNKSLNLIT